MSQHDEDDNCATGQTIKANGEIILSLSHQSIAKTARVCMNAWHLTLLIVLIEFGVIVVFSMLLACRLVQVLDSRKNSTRISGGKWRRFTIRPVSIDLLHQRSR
jgi:hypothetical protein